LCDDAPAPQRGRQPDRRWHIAARRHRLHLAQRGSGRAGGAVVGTDGSTARFSLTLDDFWFAPAGNEAMPYVNSPSGKYQQTVYIDYQSVAIDPNK
jgi:hypothetical protein